MRSSRILVLALAAPLLAVPVHAQIDLTGTWTLNATTQLSGEATPCVYVGTVEVSQSGATWTGPTELGLIGGPPACPAEMLGDLTGTLSGNTIDGTIDGGQTGFASFSGTISPNPGGSGTFAVNQGPFVDEDGSWTAVLQQSLLAIPELTPVGLTLLVLLTLGTGVWALHRQGA